MISKITEKIKDFAERMAIQIINSMGSIASLIVHTVLFVLAWLFTDFLFLTTVVSLEAIYLSILIQMSVNFQSKKLQSIQENVEDIQENVEDIQENVEEIQGDVEEIQEDVEEINDEEETEDDEEDDEDIKEINATMKVMQDMLEKLMKEVVELKKKQTRNENAKSKRA
jgi:biopolymer transport protein ExbB/TolQ